MGLLYTGHFDETARVVDWIERALPRAERYATEGLTLHKTHVQYASGAKFGPLLGYDGTILTPPTEGEGFVWAHENYPGINLALSALSHIDWAADASREATAKRILRVTTEVVAQDMQWDPEQKAYLDRHMANTVQHSAAIYGLRESVRRGVADPDWAEMADKVLLPAAEWEGRRVIPVAPGVTILPRTADPTWLSPLWWYGIIEPTDPLARTTYDLLNRPQWYIFNRGWMGVLAAKLGLGEDAYRWARSFLEQNISLFDDTCFSETDHDFEDFKKTPEIAAHAALVCNVAQMLLDPDDEKTIRVFPAIPDSWRREGVSFRNLAARGGIAVSGRCEPGRLSVTLENRSNTAATRQLRLRLPDGAKQLSESPDGARVEESWAALDAIRLEPGDKATFVFVPVTGK